MVKEFTAKCDFNGEKHPVKFYVGDPAEGSHPLAFQSNWLAQNRFGNVPHDIMEAFKKISDIAQKHKVPFVDLCSYVIDELKDSENFISDFNKATEFCGAPSVKEEDNDEDDEEIGVKSSKTSKMQKGSGVVEQGANPQRQEQILQEKYASKQVDNASTDPNVISGGPKDPNIIEESGVKKKKQKKGEAPIADEGMQNPLKHKRLEKKQMQERKQRPVQAKVTRPPNFNPHQGNFSFYGSAAKQNNVKKVQPKMVEKPKAKQESPAIDNVIDK